MKQAYAVGTKFFKQIDGIGILVRVGSRHSILHEQYYEKNKVGIRLGGGS